MTVKEVIAHLEDPKRVDLSWNGNLVSFNFQNLIELEVWGKYQVRSICACKEAEFEIVLATALVAENG